MLSAVFSQIKRRSIGSSKSVLNLTAFASLYLEMVPLKPFASAVSSLHCTAQLDLVYDRQTLYLYTALASHIIQSTERRVQGTGG